MSDSMTCVVCNKEVAGQVLKAMGKSYHPDCFKCSACNEPIKEERFQVDKEQKIYCDPCYTKLFLSTCKKCGEPIKEKVIKALNADWHEECFLCTDCGKKLTGTPFYERDGNPYCEEDFQLKFSPRCKKCDKPIVDQAISALDSQWHPDCFACNNCKKPITGSVFQVDDKGLPVCESCADELGLGGCSKSNKSS